MKILLITRIYPIPGVHITGSTAVCHYFAQEWQKEGHEVLVVNTYTVYPRPLHWLSHIFDKTIANKNAVTINKVRFSKPFEYMMDGIKILLSPTYKPFPRKPFNAKSIDKTAYAIKDFLKRNDFVPDVVTTHFIHPNLELIPLIKQVYPSAKYGVSLHGKVTDMSKYDVIEASKKDVDFWGFRSYPIGQSFIDKCFRPSKYLYCFSGVPQEYINHGSYEKHNHKGVEKFLFVGNLNRRKHPMTVLEALMSVGGNFDLTYVGDGKQTSVIQKVAKKDNISKRVHLLGRLPRHEVADKMLEAECFIMVSEEETFGLVYLEAMARGCIVVASKDEGMDGIIQHGVNGFLCEAGNKDELASIIEEIRQLSPERKIQMAQNAIQTASDMSDSKVAKDYSAMLESFVKS